MKKILKIIENCGSGYYVKHPYKPDIKIYMSGSFPEKVYSVNDRNGYSGQIIKHEDEKFLVVLAGTNYIGRLEKHKNNLFSSKQYKYLLESITEQKKIKRICYNTQEEIEYDNVEIITADGRTPKADGRNAATGDA